MIITLVFEKNANFFAENWEKSQKIVIITSTLAITTLVNYYYNLGFNLATFEFTATTPALYIVG
jgi:hypothetical protein